MALPGAEHRRLALGVSYQGQGFRGWQSQPGGGTVQDALEAALTAFVGQPIQTVCAGRTDAGVHGLNQVVHLDSPVARELFSWVRGTNRYLPPGVAVQWAREVGPDFHARFHARGRRYRYVVLNSPVRPSLEAGAVGWVFKPLSVPAMLEAAQVLLGEHDFSAFRSAECQAKSPIKTMRQIDVRQRDEYIVFEFDGSAFLHHMVRNIMGCLVMVGTGVKPPEWMHTVLASRSRQVAAPTFAADGLYFVGPYYDAHWQLPQTVPGMAWVPR